MHLQLPYYSGLDCVVFFVSSSITVVFDVVFNDSGTLSFSVLLVYYMH